MSNDYIDLTFDEEENNESNDIGCNTLLEGTHHDTQEAINTPSRSLEVYACLSNLRTLDIIQSYRNSESETFRLPVIVNVQSLAPQTNESDSKIMTASVLPNSKKVAGKKSVFNKQKFQRPTSSSTSIDESIESCIKSNMIIDSEKEEIYGSSSKNTGQEVTTKLAMEEGNYFTTPSRSPYGDKVGVLKLETTLPSSSNAKPIEVEEAPMVVSDNTMLFREFLCKCVSLEEDDKDRRRADQKLRSYHEKASLEYKESETFADLLKKQMENINRNNLYEHLKIILDELKINRKIVEVSKLKSSDEDTEAPKLDAKTEGQVIKLTSFLEKLHRKIRKIEEKEVDFNEEDDEESAYICLHRYRERFTKIHKKICELTGKSEYADRISKKKIRFDVTAYPEVNKAVERWLNKKKQFPDFSDVVQVLSNVDLNLRPDQSHNLAAEIFREIGKLLQKRRKLELWDSLSAFESLEEDPASSDSNLNAILMKNRKIYQAKEEELINMYARKQQTGECSNDAPHDSNDESEDCSNSDSSQQQNIDDNSMGAEENASDEQKSDEVYGHKEFGEVAIDGTSEKIDFPPPSRTPLTEMVVLGDEVKANTYEQPTVIKRRQSDDINVISKKRVCPITITESPPKQDLNRKSLKSSKPFGTAGKVIELNYCSVQNLNANVLSSIFKDRTNTFDHRAQTFSSVIKEISHKYEMLKINYSKLMKSNIIYKAHGAVGHGASSNEKEPSRSEKKSSTVNQTAEKTTTNAGEMSGSGGSGDDDKDQEKKNNSVDKTDLDDEEAIDDEDCEPDTTIDSGTYHAHPKTQISDSLLQDLNCAKKNETDDIETEEKVENMTEIEKDPQMSEVCNIALLNANSNESPENLDDEKNTDVKEPFPSDKDTLQINIKVRDDLKSNLNNETSKEKEAEPDSQQSDSSKKFQKPAWIDNGEESDNDSVSAPNEPEKTIEASISCLSEKVVTSTSSLKIVKTKGLKNKKKAKSKSKTKKKTLDRKAKQTTSSMILLKKTDEQVKPPVTQKKNITTSHVVKKKIEPLVKEDTNDEIEVISETIVKKPVLTGEERVKRFLESAKDSLSITVTRKRAMSKETVDAVNQLKKLKNISTTRVVLPSSSRNNTRDTSQAGPSRIHEQYVSLPTVRRTQPTYSPNQLSHRFPNLPLNRLMISNVRGSGNRINRYPYNRMRNTLPVISSVQSINPGLGVGSVRGPRLPLVRLNASRGLPQTRRRASASQVRGRGTGRGNRIVPIVVLD